MTNTVDVTNKSPNEPSSLPAMLEHQSNEAVNSSNVQGSLSSFSIQQPSENGTLMTALGVSPCASLGLGSNSIGQAENTAEENESSKSEDANEHDVINESILSHNVTMRKSIRISNQNNTDDESDVGSYGFSLLEQKAPSVAPSDEVDPAQGSVYNEKSELPKEVTTKAVNDVSHLLMSPMSPDAFRLSDGFDGGTETNYGGPIANDDIAGLSPIVAIRESTVSAMRTSPSNTRSHDDEVQGSTSPCTVTSHVSSNKGDDPPEERSLLSSHHCKGCVAHGEPDNESVDKDYSATDKSAVVDDEAQAAGESRHETSTAGIHSPQEDVSVSHQDNVSNEEMNVEKAFDNGDTGAAEEEKEVQQVTTLDPNGTSTLQDAEKRQNLWDDVGSVMSSSASSQDDDARSFDKEQSSVGKRAVVYEAEELSRECIASSMISTEVDKADAECSNVDTRDEQATEQRLDGQHFTRNDIGQDDSASGSAIAQQTKESTSNGAVEQNESVDDDSMQSLLSDTDDEQGETSAVDTSSGNVQGARKEPTIAYRDLTSAKKHIDASSMAFIERLRGAAHRRKLRVARSRDSLAAKEREHLLSIASANERRLVMAPKETQVTTHSSSTAPIVRVEPYKPFKARPAPSTTGQLGSGGQVGVPKIEKKPTTTPFSPLLGARRPQKENISSLEPPLRDEFRRSTSRLVSKVTKSLTPKKKSRDESLPFKARPAPPTTGIQGHGGQVGVPKIEKRPTTVPVSPGLGIWRRNSMPAGSRPNPAFAPDPKAKRKPTTVKPFARLLSGSEVCWCRSVILVCVNLLIPSLTWHLSFLFSTFYRYQEQKTLLV